MSRTVEDINGENIQVLTEAEIDAALAEKADKLDTYSKQAVDDKLDAQADVINAQLEQISEKMSVWIREHNMHEDGAVGNIRTRIIYKDADQNEIVEIIPGEVISTAELNGQTTVTWVSDHYDTQQTTVLEGVIVMMERQQDTGTDDYNLLQNLPYVSYTDAGGVHKEYIKGDITALIRQIADDYQLLANKPVVKYTDKDGNIVEKTIEDVTDIRDLGVGTITYINNMGETVTKNIGPDLDISDLGMGLISYVDKSGTTVKKRLIQGNTLDISDIGVGKVKYFNRQGQIVTKDIHAADEILDLTDIGMNELVFKVTYVDDQQVEHTENLRARAIIEYTFDPSTYTTTLRYIAEAPDGTTTEQEITYPGDVTEIVPGYASGEGTNNYRELEHLPTITWIDETTQQSVTRVLRGDVTDDVTSLLQHVIGGSSASTAYNGTLTAWEQMSVTEQNQYDQAFLKE